MKKILVIQLRQLGDVIMTTPVVRGLKKLYPQADIDFLTEKLGGNVYKYNRHVSHLKVIPRKIGLSELYNLISELRKEQYDLVIDCFSNPKSAQITFFAGAGESTGFELGWRKNAYSTAVKINNNLEYAALSKLKLIEKFGADLSDYRIEFPVDEEQKDKAALFAKKHDFDDNTVAFCTVSRRDFKVWNPNHFAKAGDWLLSRGYKLWFVYGPGEKDLALQVYSRLSDKNWAIVDYDMPDVIELRAILERCKMYVGNDGGSKHLAICAKIPTVTVFGSVRWQNWTPPDSKTDHVVYKNMDCYDKCRSCTNMRCYKELTEKDLIAKLEEVL